MKQVWQAEDGKIFKTEKECSFYEEQKRMHQEILEDNNSQDILFKKWLEENNTKKLYGEDAKKLSNETRENVFRRSAIFRSADNQYFNNLEEYKIYEKELRKRDLSKIIENGRVWRSSNGRYCLTEEECLIEERTAFDGSIFDSFEEMQAYEAKYLHDCEMEHIEQLEKERSEDEEQLREIYGVNWGDEPWEQPDEENLWDPIEGSPN